MFKYVLSDCLSEWKRRKGHNACYVCRFSKREGKGDLFLNLREESGPVLNLSKKSGAVSQIGSEKGVLFSMWEGKVRPVTQSEGSNGNLFLKNR